MRSRKDEPEEEFILHRRRSNPFSINFSDGDPYEQKPKQVQRSSNYLCLKITVALISLVAIVAYFNNRSLIKDSIEGTGPSSQSIVSPCNHEGKPAVQYALMMDAGSTGSRIHVYKFNYCNSDLPVLEDEVFEQLKPGLSSFSGRPTEAADSIVPLLETAKKTIPTHLHSCTPVALKATAGLRLLGKDQADAILGAVEKKIREYPFQLVENGVIIMDGAKEGVYAWITVNYLLKNIGGSAKKDSTVAIMDLGGASTQIVFEPNPHALTDKDLQAKDYWYHLPFGETIYQLYQHSYLEYGLMVARDKIKNATVQGITEITESEYNHPCLLPGHKETFSAKNKTIILVGTASGMEECTNLVKYHLFDPKDECKRPPCSFAGAYQPPFKNTFAANDIYVFSYFYDRLEPLGIKSDFTLKEMKRLVHQICKSDDATSELVKENPDYCIDMVYLYSLLSHGYSISEERKLTLAKKINGMETGWCLGASIHMLDKAKLCTV